jgi:hypothetical protein
MKLYHEIPALSDRQMVEFIFITSYMMDGMADIQQSNFFKSKVEVPQIVLQLLKSLITKQINLKDV